MKLFRKLFGKKGQNVTEYSLLIMLVMAGVLVMGPYIIRSWNANLKGWEDSIFDSFTDPLEFADATDFEIPPCVCSLEPPCPDPPCCAMLGCADYQEAYLAEVCGPGDCTPPNHTPLPTECVANEECCTDPVPNGECDEDIPLARDEFGNVINWRYCTPAEKPHHVRCGDRNRRVCIGDPECVFECLPPPDPTLIHNAQLCEGDDDNLFFADLPYQYVGSGQCSARKCELECLDTFILGPGGVGCVCPPNFVETVDGECPRGYCDQTGCPAQHCMVEGECVLAAGKPKMEWRFNAAGTPEEPCAFGYFFGIEVRLCFGEDCSNWTPTQDPGCLGCALSDFPDKSLHIYVSGDKNPNQSIPLKTIHPREIEARTSLYLGDGLYLTLNSWGAEPVQTQPSPFEAHGQPGGEGTDGGGEGSSGSGVGSTGDSDGPSTPYLFTYSGNNYYIENDVMNTYRNQYMEVAKERYENHTPNPHYKEIDYYKLRLKPDITPNGLRLMLKELEPEESHIDQMKLVRILHPKDSEVVIDHEQNKVDVVKSTKLDYLVACTTNTGKDCQNDLRFVDDQFTEGDKGSEVTLQFDVSNLELNDLKNVADNILTVKVQWTAHHFIDHVGLIRAESIDYREEELALTEATHSKTGDTLESLKDKDNVYAHTVRGDHIELTFKVPADQIKEDEQESYLFVSSGFFHGLRTYLYPAVDVSNSFEKEIEGYVDELETLIDEKVKQ